MRYDNDSKMPRAYTLGSVSGRRVHRFTVRIAYTGSTRRLPPHVTTEYHEVVAHSAGDACNYAMDHLVDFDRLDPVSVCTRGPKGGLVERYAGYEGVIWRAMCRAHDVNKTARLPFGG